MTKALAVRPPVLEGDVIDGELESLIQTHGLMAAIQIRMWRRYDDHMMREILQPQCFVPGANPELPMMEVEVS